MVARALATSMLGLMFSTAAEGSTIVYSALNPVSIPGISGFNTGGTDMDGLSVTATFADSTSQTLFWADAPAIGPEAGGVFGTGWGLFVNNSSTYNGQVWTYFAQANTPQLTSLVLDGSTGLTVFDTMFWEDAPAYSNGELRPEVPETSPGSGIYRGDQGTPGSDLGLEFRYLGEPSQIEGLDNLTNLNIVATYLVPVAVDPNGPIGDIYQRLEITLPTGLTFPLIPGRTDGARFFTFTQDTDNDSRYSPVPEPATLLLFGAGTAAVAARRRWTGRRAAQR